VAVASSCRLKPNPGPASIFVSDQAKSGWRWYWRFMARGGVSFHPVPGSHHDILKPRYLPVLVATLRTVLEQKQAAAGAVPLVSGPPHATSAK
jgi:thioesterase domain-containing protein